MYILSIDVGIKNLAHCLIKIDENKCYEIVLWNTVNLCNVTKKFCNEPLKTKKKNGSYTVCNKVATLTKNNECFCKTHAKNKPFLIPGADLVNHKIPKTSVDKLRALAVKYEIDLPIHTQSVKKQINSSIKLTNEQKKNIIVENIQKFMKEKVFEPIDYDSANNINLVDLGVNMLYQYDEIFNNYNIDKVIIENQIGTVATRMKTIQGMIMQYFIMKHTQDIEFISSTNKLKLFVKEKTTYAERKQLGIIYCLNIISKNNLLTQWWDIFNAHKKKDDLADCFLQGLWYMNEHTLISNL